LFMGLLPFESQRLLAEAAEPTAEDGRLRSRLARLSCPFAGMTRIRFKGFPRCPYCVSGRGGFLSSLPELPSELASNVGPRAGVSTRQEPCFCRPHEGVTKAGTHTPQQGDVAGPAMTETLMGYGSPPARGRQRRVIASPGLMACRLSSRARRRREPGPRILITMGPGRATVSCPGRAQRDPGSRSQED